MADLGAVGTTIEAFDIPRFSPVISPAIYRPSVLADAQPTSFDLSGKISGTVVIAGVPQADIHVGLMHRSSMNLVALAKTDGAGFYEFRYLDINDTENYFVVFLDPRLAAPWNYSLVRDHLSPG